MAEKSAISWTKSTFNPWIGCTRISPGCDHCYAAVSTPARSLGVKWGSGAPRHRTSAANWRQPLKWNAEAARTGKFWPLFCSSLADVFDHEVPTEWREDLFRLIEQTPHLTWQLLTKRIGNAAEMMFLARGGHLPLLPNVWLGATIVNQAEADRDIPKLLKVPAVKRFVSYEPALGPVDFDTHLIPDRFLCEGCDHTYNCVSDDTRPPLECPSCGDDPVTRQSDRGIDWVICGGESDQLGAKARPFNIEWALSTVIQCKASGVACFVKQLGSAPEVYRRPLPLVDRAGADPAEWPDLLRVQQFPDGLMLESEARA